MFATPVIGMFIGAFIAAWKSKELRIKKANPKYLVYAVAGGIMIGFGNFLGAGCPIRHGIVGFAGLAIESWIAFPAMVIGVIIGTKLLIKYLA